MRCGLRKDIVAVAERALVVGYLAERARLGVSFGLVGDGAGADRDIALRLPGTGRRRGRRRRSGLRGCCSATETGNGLRLGGRDRECEHARGQQKRRYPETGRRASTGLRPAARDVPGMFDAARHVSRVRAAKAAACLPNRKKGWLTLR